MKKFERRVLVSLDELEHSILELGIVRNFKSFGELTLEERKRLESTLGEEITSVQKLRNLVALARVFIFPSTRQVDFWRVRGFTVEEAKTQVSQVQRKNVKKKLIKYQPGDFKRFSVRCVEYWVEKGFSVEDAKKEIRKRQATNSLESLKKRYGEEKAQEVRKEITRKWQETLKSKDLESQEKVNKLKGNCRYKLKGRKFSEEHKRNISRSKIGQIPHNKGKTWDELYSPETVERLKANSRTPERRKKRRQVRIKQIEERHGCMFPNYNKNSIAIIEEFGKKEGFSFQHAENGGEYRIRELGYWVDAYDVEQNVVLEIDEEHHFTTSGELREQDRQRQREIEQFLGCRFIRIKYEKNKN